MTVEIWSTKTECWNCGEETVLWYPPSVGSYAGGTWEPVGEYLAQEEDSPIQRVYSEVQKTDVWGNICQNCGEYYGNFYVHKNAMETVYQYSLSDVRNHEVVEFDVFFIDIPLTEDYTCTNWSEDQLYLPESLLTEDSSDGTTVE